MSSGSCGELFDEGFDPTSSVSNVVHIPFYGPFNGSYFLSLYSTLCQNNPKRKGYSINILLGKIVRNHL